MTENFAEKTLTEIVSRSSSVIQVLERLSLLGYREHLMQEGNKLRSVHSDVCYHYLHFDVDEIGWIDEDNNGDGFLLFALTHRYNDFRGIWITA